MKVRKLAGIDIGSNSVRLLVSNVFKDQKTTFYKKSSLTRLPIRLGTDSFKKEKISKKTVQKLITGMQAYRRIMEVHNVEVYRACATSALREALNGEEVINRVRKETDVNIELIDGAEEARMIFNAEFVQHMSDQEDSFLYVDVGGGSTECTLFHKTTIVCSKSFKIGTIRLLNNMVQKEHWDEMKLWIKTNTAGLNDVLSVGSGGNINRTFKLSGKQAGHPLRIDFLENTYTLLSKFSAEDRMIKFDFNPDRADVITHALRIFISVMNWANSERIVVPKKGLADGIIRDLYKTHFK